jgi:hypothetical protein
MISRLTTAARKGEISRSARAFKAPQTVNERRLHKEPRRERSFLFSLFHNQREAHPWRR